MLPTRAQETWQLQTPEYFPAPVSRSKPSPSLLELQVAGGHTMRTNQSEKAKVNKQTEGWEMGQGRVICFWV